MTAITDGLIRPLHHKPLTSLDRAKLRVMPAHALNGRFRGIADIGGFLSAMVRSRMPSRPREFHPEPLTDSGLDTLASSGSCHRTKAAAFR